MDNFNNYKAETIGLPEFDKIRNEGRLLMEYVRGSQSYGLATEESDVDTGGVYICSLDELLSFNKYKNEVSDEKSDNKWYELGTFITLLSKSNPNILEALFVPENCIIGEVHPIMQYLRENRNLFLTKKCFTTIFSFASSQIVKARGLNKKIVNPIVERKTPLDFTFTFKNQGSEPIMEFLNRYGLKREFCGLAKIPHMNDNFGMYYDYGSHLATYPNDYEILDKTRKELNPERCTPDNELSNEPIFHYRGLTTEEISRTTQLRLSSIDNKNDKPICHVSFNGDGFQDHCRRYREYKEWEENRNPVRYKSNLDKNYDSKNIMHSFRLMNMGLELAAGKGLIIDRTNIDREFLMNIRNHKFEYDELIIELDKKKEEMNNLIKTCNLPDELDESILNKLVYDLRMMQIKNNK